MRSALVLFAVGCGIRVMGDDPICEEGTTRVCGPNSTVGACHPGFQSCQARIWQPCEGQGLSTAEICDGIDNDCDGIEDNVDGVGEDCPTGLPGLCADGVRACADGSLKCVPKAPPRRETCDGHDNNCDDVIDNDPLGVGSLCITGFRGVCGGGTRICVNGKIVCDPLAQRGSERCGNGVDDNCNGKVDEGCACVLGAPQTCYSGHPDHMGRGQCSPGEQTCVVGFFGPCEGDRSATLEVCDGIDNDCDGTVDNAPVDVGVVCDSGLLGACAVGLTACTQAQLVCVATVSAQPELCGDAVDNDCSGAVDEPEDCPP